MQGDQSAEPTYAEKVIKLGFFDHCIEYSELKKKKIKIKRWVSTSLLDAAAVPTAKGAGQ